MRSRGRDDHPTARFGKAFLVRLFGHVDNDLLDDRADGRIVQREATGEPIESPYHFLDRGSFDRLAHSFTGGASRIAVRTMLRL